MKNIKECFYVIARLSCAAALFLSCASITPKSVSQNPVQADTGREYYEKTDFFMLKERGMVLRRETYSYTGGAHGTGSTCYYVLDLAGKKMLKLDDFFREETGVRLYSIVLNELRRYSNLQGGAVLADGQGLSQGIFFDDSPGLTDNFFINKEGLGLNWAPSEIAPHSAGSIEIVLPWRSLSPLLRHDAMELLELFGIPVFM